MFSYQNKAFYVEEIAKTPVFFDNKILKMGWAWFKFKVLFYSLFTYKKIVQRRFWISYLVFELHYVTKVYFCAFALKKSAENGYYITKTFLCDDEVDILYITWEKVGKKKNLNPCFFLWLTSRSFGTFRVCQDGINLKKLLICKYLVLIFYFMFFFFLTFCHWQCANSPVSRLKVNFIISLSRAQK